MFFDSSARNSPIVALEPCPDGHGKTGKPARYRHSQGHRRLASGRQNSEELRVQVSERPRKTVARVHNEDASKVMRRFAILLGGQRKVPLLLE